MKRENCVPEVPASQMVLTIITDEQLEAFADAVITKYQQNIVSRKATAGQAAKSISNNNLLIIRSQNRPP